MTKADTNHIPDGWIETTLGKLVTFQRGHDLPKSKIIDGPYPIMGSNGIIGYHHQSTTKAPGVTIGRSGNIGHAFLIKSDFWAHNTTLYAKHFNASDPTFIYFLVKHLKFDRFNSGSAVPSLNRNFIHPIPLNAPPLPEQRAIAGVLSSLDDKIELLRKQNETLEAIAQTIFKEWFVNFNFPDKNGKPYKDSGGKMIDSELGPIPDGWRVGKLEDITSINNGFAFKSGDYVLGGYPIVRTKNFTKDGFVAMTELVFLTDENAEVFKKYNLALFDFLLVMVGASLGKRAVIMKHNIPSLQNQNMWNCRPKQELMRFHNIQLLKRVIDTNVNSATGSAREFFRKDFFYDIEVTIPDDTCLSQYDGLMRFQYDKMSNNLSQIQTLTRLRDALLPKLMSGQVRVKI